MLVGGLLMITISLLGMATIHLESPALPQCYGVFLIPAFIISLVSAVAFSGLVMTSDKGLQGLCEANIKQSKTLEEKFTPY